MRLPSICQWSIYTPYTFLAFSRATRITSSAVHEPSVATAPAPPFARFETNFAVQGIIAVWHIGSFLPRMAGRSSYRFAGTMYGASVSRRMRSALASADVGNRTGMDASPLELSTDGAAGDSMLRTTVEVSVFVVYVITPVA